MKQLGKEGYEFEIADKVVIKAYDPKGAFWATRTLLQMLSLDSLHKTLAKGITRDYPKYSHRGFMLDCGRKFFTIDFLRNYVRFMSYYKMNEFQVHLSDNGFKGFFGDDWAKTYSAFRLQSDTYPGLTAKDGSYSKKEWIDLQKLGIAYGINVIPEIDIPAHTLAFGQYMPEIGSKKYGLDHLDLDNQKTYDFLDNLFKEYLEGPDPVFIGPDVHIGTDEYNKAESEKFRAFTDRYLKYIASFGKNPRMWGSLTHCEGKTPVKSDNVIMNAWYNGYAEPIDMIEQGYKLISTPDGLLYIVPAAGYYYDYLDTEYLFEKWEPIQVGDELFPLGHPAILGGMFCEWNDHVGNGISEKDVHHRVFPAMQVLSQKMWKGGSDRLDYNGYLNRVKYLGEGPGQNMMGIVKTKTQDGLVLYLSVVGKQLKDLSGNKLHPTYSKKNINGGVLNLSSNSKVTLPIAEIGYGYTILFDIQPNTADLRETVLFKSANATVLIGEADSAGNKICFTRDGYHYSFKHHLADGQFTHIAIQGDNLGTALFINGKLVEKLQGQITTFPGTDLKMNCIQTLVFPLQSIGDGIKTFNGKLKELKVYNRILTEKEISDSFKR